MKELQYIDETHEYKVDGKKLISVTEVLTGVGLVDMRSVPQEILLRAQKFGKALHYATALDDVGRLDMASLKDSVLLAHLESWRKFKKENGYDFTEQEIEQKMYHPIFNFAGTPDRWKIRGNELHIPDIKTSTQMYDSTAIQTGGYELLIQARFKVPFKKVVRLGVQTGEKYHIEYYKDPMDKTVFLGYLNTLRWELSKNVRREWRKS